MTKTMTENPVCHFELPIGDLESAKKFYSIFNWEINEIPGMDYISVRTTPVNDHQMPIKPGAINGGMMKKSKDFKHPVIAIQVDSVDEYQKKVISKGGKVVMPKIEIPNMGYYAYIADPEGNVLGLWEPM